MSHLQNTEKCVNFALPLKIQRLKSFQLQGPLDRDGAPSTVTMDTPVVWPPLFNTLHGLWDHGPGDQVIQSVVSGPLILHMDSLAASTVLYFLKFKLLTADMVKKAILHHCAKFRDDWWNCCWDMLIYHFLQNGSHPFAFVLCSLIVNNCLLFYIAKL